MSTGISLDNLALMLGVDSSAMTTGFMSASASSRAMTRSLMDGLNRELEKGNQEAAENFARMPQLASAQFAAHIGEYKKYVKEIQTLQQSISSAMIAGMSRFGRVDAVAAGMTAAFRDQRAQKEAERLAEEEQKRLAHMNQERIKSELVIRQIRKQQAAAREQELQQEETALRRVSVAKRLQLKLDQDAARVRSVDVQRLKNTIAQNEANKQQKEAERLAEAERARLAQLNQERIKAETLIHRIRRQQNEANAANKQAAQILAMLQTPQEAHNARLVIFKDLLTRGKINQDQFNAAVKQSEGVMRSSAAGAGKMAGVLAQLSFGIEDFAQGVVMGDLRSALLGASNNMTMVARGLIDMAGETKIAGMAVGKFVGIVAGAVAVGAGLAYYLNWLSQAIRDTRSLSDALRDATMGFDKLAITRNRITAVERERIEIRRIKDLDTLARKEEDLAQRQIENERDLLAARNKGSVKANEIINQMMGGAEARADIENMLAKMESSGNEEVARAAIELQKNIANAQRLISEGNADTAIAEMRKVFEFLNSESSRAFAKLFMLGGASREDINSIFFDRTALNALEEYFQKDAFFAGESAEKLREIREQALRIAEEGEAAEREKAQIQAAAIEIELRRRELQEERLAAVREETLLTQKQAESQKSELLFLITATEHQKELLRLKKETEAFAGGPPPAVPGLGFGGIAAGIGGLMNNMAFDMAAEERRIQFLEAQRQQLQQELNTLMQKEVKPAGQLEQNAFQAQADAFKQIVENMSNKPNPQVTRIINLITSIDAALRNSGVIKVVP